MKILYAWLAVFLIPFSSFAGSTWNPTGKYGYSTETGIPEHAANSYHLQIKPWGANTEHPKNSYSVSIDSVQGPTGHLCAFQGDGILKNGALEVTPDKKLKTSEDDEWWINCRITITGNEDGSLNVSEGERSKCSSLFLCGARAGIGSSNLKRNDNIEDIPFHLPNP